MPTPSSARESRRDSSSKSSATAKEASKRSGHRREKTKSSQTYDSRRQTDGTLGSANIRPQLSTVKGRTNSAPLIDRGGAGSNTPQADGHGDQTAASSTASTTPRVSSYRGKDAQDEDEVAGVVGAVRAYRPFKSFETPDSLSDINVIVLGARGVGKSTFIQKALDVSFPGTSRAAERKIHVKASDYFVRLLEVAIDDVDWDEDDETVIWPETIDDKMMPRIDGALVLYDITDKTSLESVPEMLKAISQAGISLVLVSCKCDARPEDIQVDPSDIEQRARRPLKTLNTLQTSIHTPETNQRALSMILRDILSPPPAEDGMRSSSATRRRAMSNAVRSVSPRPPSDLGHTRATSEYTGSLHKDQRHSRHDSSIAGYGSSDRLKVPHEVPQEDMGGSFLIEESASEASAGSARSSVDAVQIAAALPPLAMQSTSTLSEFGTTFEELVDRLLAMPKSKADQKFTEIFLALYRKFAAPGQLLEAIVERYEALDRDGSAFMIKVSSQQRIVLILGEWIGSYPGDFAYPKTKQRIRTLVGKLSLERIHAHACTQMNADLDEVHEDDDTNWAFNDQNRASDAIRISLTSAASTLIDDPNFVAAEEFSSSGSTLLDDTSPTSPSGADPARLLSTVSIASQLLHKVELAQKQAQLLTPIPRQPITKIQWRQLMEYPDFLIAEEVTRMDWVMFSAIRPRDLVRQVSVNAGEKTKWKNLAHVDRMINHFNHLAFWVANYVLLRDKPKHRALMLEKFMRIARKLRELNNYDALGAVIAGVRSTSVHRLNATRELISPQIGKDWMKLELLMSPTRSHFAYRLAWENSLGERIPYLPLHRRDLVSAEEGNKTFIGDEKDGRINWKKFEVMGEVIVSLQKAQGMQNKTSFASGSGQLGVKELLLDGKLVKDEDDLFERSKLVEPTSSSSGATSTRIKEFFKR